LAEVRTMLEGSLRHVQASGSGSTWATAATPVSGIFAFVRSMSWTSAATLSTIKDRGRPHHHKIVGFDAVQVTVNAAWTGGMPSAASGGGASVPMFHLEYRASAAETPTTGVYFQFHGVPIHNIQVSEGENEDTIQLTFVALAMNGPTASGFLS
jgi:hypothetical protein